MTTTKSDIAKDNVKSPADPFFPFLRAVAANNNRPWFQAHKAEYTVARDAFEQLVGQAIATYSKFDTEIATVTPRDSIYRFYRDIRFSPDKSPYKRHFGAYICAHGKKALRGGYYIHIQPGQCLFAVGSYWLPTNILTSCRNEIMTRIDEWRSIVESRRFVHWFGHVGEGRWDDDEVSTRGFGGSCLKTCPAGFPRDYPYLDYLRIRDYCAWHRVPDNVFLDGSWLKMSADMFRTAKPMMDFINSVVDDYE